MNRFFLSRALLHGLRAVLLSSVLLLQFAGAVQPVSAAGPPVITEGSSLSLVISRNGTPYAFNLTLHATDPDPGDTLTWSVSSPASHGTAGASGTGLSQAVTYAPVTDYAGPDSFAVQVDDGTGGTDSITIDVTVAPGTGLVTNVMGVSDMGWNWMAYQGLLQAETNLGITKSLYEPVISDDYLTLLQKCADDGNRVCFAVDFLLADAVTAAAAANPGTKFAILDTTYESYPANLRGIGYASEEAAFLAGALAGKMTSTNVIGVIGGMNIPPVTAFVNGYRNGAQCANPNLQVLAAYANDFVNPGLGATMAQQMMDQNADVIFAPAGTDSSTTGGGAILHSAQNGIWSIGVDTDAYQNLFGNGTVAGSNELLTSAMKRLDNALYMTIQDYMNGTFSSGTVTYNLAQGGVGIAPFHETDSVIPLATKTYLDNLKAKIISGSTNANITCRFTGSSSAPQDGWILESTETSNMGGTLNVTATNFYLGDDALDRQYRSILSFNTAGLPDNAVITKVTLKIRKQALVGSNPFATHGNILIDIKKGFFSSNVALQVIDFQAAPSKPAIGTIKNLPLAGGWYQTNLLSTGFPYINKTGITQFRLRFTRDDNDDLGADYLKFYSGSASAAYRPQLLISYRQP